MSPTDIHDMSLKELNEALMNFKMLPAKEARKSYLSAARIIDTDSKQTSRYVLGVLRCFYLIIELLAKSGNNSFILDLEADYCFSDLSEEDIGANPNILLNVFRKNQALQIAIQEHLEQAGYTVIRTNNEFIIRW